EDDLRRAPVAVEEGVEVAAVPVLDLPVQEGSDRLRLVLAGEGEGRRDDRRAGQGGPDGRRSEPPHRHGSSSGRPVAVLSVALLPCWGRPSPESRPPMRSLPTLLLALAALLADGPMRPVGRLEHPAICEASGIVKSRRHPGIFWVHNDS